MLLRPHDDKLRLLLVATALLLMLSSFGCATKRAPDVTPVAPKIPAHLTERCPPLPLIEPDMADGSASEGALNEDSDVLEDLYISCAGRFDRLIEALKG